MSEQLFLEAFNSEPYFFEKEEKYGAMDIIYTFEDEAGHGFKFHFEKKVALGKHAYVCVLSQKTPGLKTYKRVIGKFSNPMRTVATLLAVVRDIHDTRKDVHGIVMSIPEQAFGSYARLVKKIMTRELRTVLNVEDGEYTPEDFEKMGLVGIVTTVKPRNMNTVYTGPALKEYQERQAGKDGISTPTPAAVVPDVKAPAAVKKPDFAAPVEVEFNVQAPDGRILTLKVDRLSFHSLKDSDGNFVREDVFKGVDIRFIVTAMREYTNVAKMIPIIQSTLVDGFTVASVPQYRGKVASKGITNLNKPDGPVDLPKQTSVAQTMPVVDPVAEKEPFYFDYDHRQIALTFDNAEIAGRIKDQLLELGAATFNDSEFFTDKEKLILLDDKSLDVKKVQATLFPILGQPVTMNGVSVDPNVRSSVRSPDGVTYHIKGNTIQVEDAPKDSAAKIVGMIIPGVSRIFDDKGNNTIELNAAGIADGHEISNFVKVLKSISINEELSRYVFMDWDSIAGDAMDKYDLSTSSFKSLATNDGQYLINDSYAGLVAEYTKSAGNVINGVVFKSTYRASDRITNLFSKDGYKVEHNVGGWGTQITIPLGSDFKLPAHDNLAKLIKELDNLSCFDRNRSVVEYVGGSRNFIAKFMPEDSRVGLRLPTDDAGYLAWRDYTSYATSPNFIRFDDIETLDQFQALVAKVKDFDFGANLLRNIGVSKYFADVRSGGREAKKTYKLKDGGEVEITFEFGDKVMIAFNQASQGFDKDLSEWADEKNEIFGRISAIALYKLGTADANKTLKNIDAWLDDHIVSKEDNVKSGGDSFQVTLNGYDGEDDVYGIDEISVAITGSENLLANMKAKLTPIISKYNIEELKVMDGGKALVAFFDKYSSNSTAKRFIDFLNNEFKGPQAKAAENVDLPLSAKPEETKQSGTLEIVTSLASSNDNHYIIIQDGSLTTKSAYGSPRTEGFWRFSPKGMTYSDGEEFVKAEIMKMYNSGASNLVIKATVNEWLKPKNGFVIDVRGDRTSSGVTGTTDKNPKNLVKPLLTAIASVAKDGKEKKVTGFDLRVGETWAYDGQRGEMNNLMFISGPNSADLDGKLRSLGAAVLLRGVTRVGDLTIEFEDVAKKRKSKLTFTCGGLVQGSFESLKGSFSPATKSKVDKLISKMFTDSPQAIANEFADFIGNPDLRYKIVKDARKPAILISKNPAGFKEALANAELLLESQLDEGIKEDLTGKAPNRVKRELLEATLQKLGLYRESFSYGNATFKTVMTECAVEIIPTSGNIRNFAKMLGARLGVELRIDDEGFLSFDLDNI